MATGAFIPFQSTASGGSGSDSHYVYNQSVARTLWDIVHPLNKKPSVVVQDEYGNTMIGNINYVSNSNIQITFSAASSGVAYLN